MGDLPMALEAFTPLVGSTFRVAVGDGSIHVILSEATAIRSSPRAQSFALVFAGPLDQPLGQGVFRFEHAQSGGIELLVVPVRATTADRLEYEAIINHLIG